MPMTCFSNKQQKLHKVGGETTETKWSLYLQQPATGCTPIMSWLEPTNSTAH